MSKLRLDSVEWKEFFIGGKEGLFKVSGTITTHPSILKKGGYTPRITCAATNNGFEDIYFNRHTEKGGVLTVDSATIGFISYQNTDFIATDHVEKISFHNGEKMTKEIGLFLKTAIESATKNKYGYGYKFSQARINKQIILLPIDTTGSPNWKFMQDYIKQEQKIQAQNLINYYKQRMIECGFELLGLDDAEWKEFYLIELFNIKRGNQNNMDACNDGIIPLVSAKKVNNGYKTFISDNGKEIFEENILTLNNDGDGGVGIAFYQPHHMALDTHVTALIPKLPIDKYSLLFLSRVITNQRDKFSHGYSINNSRLQKQKIILPADKNGNPHWEYMRIFMQKLENKNLSKVLEYIYIYRLAISLEQSEYAINRINIKWNEFWLEDIVEIKSGVRLTKANQTTGKRPFIGSTDSNNGITCFVSNTNNSLDNNLLGVNYNGSIVDNFYHPYECIFSDDVKRIHFKEKTARNKYCYLFLKQCILKQKRKYAYGYKFNAERMKRQKIMLPINACGNVDYNFMKKYMLIQEIKELYKFLNYFLSDKTV